MDGIQSQIATEPTATRVFSVDAEHGRLRLVVVVLFIISGVAGYLAIERLIPSDGLNILAILGSFLVAYGVTAIFEQALKRRWPSGRLVEVSAEGVRLMQQSSVQQRIDAAQPTAALLWRFQTKRRSRVPKGWHLLAFALEQDEASISVYTLMSPDQFKKFQDNERFRVLKAKAETTGANARGRDDLLLAGEQRRLLQAENLRWQNGAEMTVDDFAAYLTEVSLRFPHWMRTP